MTKAQDIEVIDIEVFESKFDYKEHSNLMVNA